MSTSVHSLEQPRWKICVDRVLPPRTAADRLAFSRDRRWNVTDLHVRFVDPDPTGGRIQQVVTAWNDALQESIRFVFDDRAEADIRVGFQNSGNWSYVGTEARTHPQSAQTMNLGSITPGSDDATIRQVALHEFGHALGCVHEFRSPDAPIQWDEEAVYAFYAGAPNFWDRATTKANVLDRYDDTLTARTTFDPDSIMMYPIPPELTLNRTSYEWKSQLSPSDITFIRQMYS
jgi:hypothetical protein